MDMPSPLDPLDPNIPSRKINGKLQAFHQATSRELPILDSEKCDAPLSDMTTSATGSFLHVTRPSLTGIHSFQRPRKRVIWRNKACLIALPLEDEFGRKTNRASYLTQDDFEKRLQDWKDQGFNTNGFTLAPQTSDLDSSRLEGQSRAVHPDPEDLKHERANGIRVIIPVQRHWEAYVKHLKEDKLRALGVDEQIPRDSPVLPIMSRQESLQSSAMQTSPSLTSSSHMAPFHPSLYDAVIPGSNISKPGIAHFPTYSMAYGFDASSLMSPSQSPHPPEAHIPRSWSPQRSRLASPHIEGQVQTMRLAPQSVPPAGLGKVVQVSNQASTDLLAGMREQQALLQMHQSQQQQHHLQQQVLQGSSSPSLGSSKYDEPILHPLCIHNRAEIAMPIPRDYRRNSSEILQKGVDETKTSISGKEGRQNAGPARLEERYDKNQAKNALDKDGGIAGPDTNVRGVADTETDRPGAFQGRCSSEGSQFNINAPKFEPRKYQNPSVFPFFGNEQAHNSVGSRSLRNPTSGLAMQARDRTSQPGRWNAEAPAFMPNTPLIIAIPSREFSFSALRPSLRPDAPAFEPSDSKNVFGFEPISEQKAVPPAIKIFGDIDFSEAAKPRKSKAVPIMNPYKKSESKSGSDEMADVQEDETGRLTQADGRLKRMRTERDEGHQIPLFAHSEVRSPWKDRGIENQATCASKTPSPESDALDTTTLGAATDLLEELIDELSATEASDLMQGDEPIDEDGKKSEEYIFNDVREAASFNAARPPDPHEVAIATRDFFAKSPQCATAFDRALGHRISTSASSCSSNKGPGSRDCDPREETTDLVDRKSHASQDTRLNIMNGVRYVEPSSNELDAIMKYLDREDSDSGLNQRPSTRSSRSATRSPMGYPGPSREKPSTPSQVLPPSSSPKGMQGNHQYLPATDSESANPSLIEVSARSARCSPSARPSKSLTSAEPQNIPISTPPSDLDEAISSQAEDKLRSKTRFGSRANDVMDGIVQRDVEPFEQTLTGIQHSFAQSSNRLATRRSRASGAHETEHSDADDEDNVDGVLHSRPKSPLKDRKLDRLKLSISEIAAAQQSFARASQLTEVMAAVRDLKVTIQEKLFESHSSGDIKTFVEEAVGRQMRGRSAPVISSSQAAAAEKSQLQLAGLESMLKIADARVNDEMEARRSIEDELAHKERSLRIALQEASEQRESAEATERSLQNFHTERQHTLQRTAMLEGSKECMQKTVLELSEKNRALEETLAEYRLSSDQWRSKISDVKLENKDLKKVIDALSAEVKEHVQSRQVLRNKADYLQKEFTKASRNAASDHISLLNKEEEYKARLEMLSSRLESEAQTRERLRLEVERIETQERDTVKTRSMLMNLQKANAHLESLLAELRSECNGYQSVVAKLREQVDLITADSDRSRSRYELLLKEASDSRSAALAEAARFHERSLKEMKEQHQRTLDNAFEDKRRAETYFGDQLTLADGKLGHYQDRLNHLEDKLEIARSAAHAAVQAAQSKNTVLNASSPSTSLLTTEASNQGRLPEKISPQALRESIIVLQEQLQERETRIEQLENQLSSHDTNAPEKLKDAEMEITWLRELLGIRTEDLDDLISTVSQPFYNPDSVKDAAIRLKANLQMEQQGKERDLTSFRSRARISDVAASPKALPLAAAAAWGNWRKGRDFAFTNLTPSKSSPHNFYSGLITPPSTEVRTVSRSVDSRMNPSSSKWSSRSPTKPKQSLQPQAERDRPLRRRPQQDPVTPPLMRKDSYDLDASESTFYEDEESNKIGE